ncbi:MAG: isoprenylcysteine carboxylmethyltransferase family protein [Acidiferrobacterales bacterium]
MNWSMLGAILILPGNVLVVIPALVLWITTNSQYGGQVAVPMEPRFWLAIILLVPGLGLSIWTARLFLKKGDGTPAPWNPPKKLVIRGPYRYVRNPMITSVLVTLSAEAIYFLSWPLLIWMVVFFLANAIYFPLFEEKGLEARFGADYLNYKNHVPRWLPRLSPWSTDTVDPS